MRTFLKITLFISCTIIFSNCEKPATACMSISASTELTGNEVTFTSCSSCTNCSCHNSPNDFQWDFGDGTSGTGSPITHTYYTPGKYTVTLTVNDCDGDAKGSRSETITIIQPDISRKGKFIAFTSNADGDDDIYLAQVDANGTLATSNLIFSSNPYNLTNAFNTMTDMEPNWSPNGRILLFTSRSAPKTENIYAFFFNTNGTLVSTTPSLLISQANAWDNNPGFSSDSTKIIFERRVDDNADGLDSADNRDLYMASITSSFNSITVNNITQITKTSGIDEGNPKWCPVISIQRVAYERPPNANSNDHDIYIIDPLNPTATNYDWNNPGSSGYPAWAPDASSITFETNSGNGGFYKIVSASYPSNAGTTDIAKNSVKDYRYPTRLPNGNLVAYIEIDPATKNGNIYIIPASGGTSVKLLPATFDHANNRFPAW